MLTKSKDLFSSSTSVNPEATRNDWAARLAELFDKAEDGSDQAYWLLATVEELRDRLREIAPAVSDTKELGVALDSAAWLHNAAENIEAEFEALGDAIIRGERREDQDLRTATRWRCPEMDGAFDFQEIEHGGANLSGR